MKLLIDECLPRTLKRLLGDHECRTVHAVGPTETESMPTARTLQDQELMP